MRLKLPLSYYQYQLVQQLAFGVLGGRASVEYSVKGNKEVTDNRGKLNAMYGGVKENFVQLIIEYSRMNMYSKFADIGSGIGQVSEYFHLNGFTVLHRFVSK